MFFLSLVFASPLVFVFCEGNAEKDCLDLSPCGWCLTTNSCIYNTKCLNITDNCNDFIVSNNCISSFGEEFFSGFVIFLWIIALAVYLVVNQGNSIKQRIFTIVFFLLVMGVTFLLHPKGSFG